MPAHQAARRLAWRRILISTLLIIAFFATSAYLLDLVTGADDGEEDPLVSNTPDPTPTGADSPSPPPTPEPRPDPPETTPTPMLTDDADVPPDGPGVFQYADSEGPVLGDSGTLRRFRLAVEENVAGDPVDTAELAEFVDTTLGDERGWTAGGDLRLQRVPDGAAYDFTIYFATGATAHELCAAGGLQIRGPGLPDGGVSCRVEGQVVLNLNRWQQSVPHFVDQDVPLQVYREMVLNHEVGHELGHGHVGCPEPGEPAPVMQQQTLFLDGCEANPWPYVDGARHTGPPVS